MPCVAHVLGCSRDVVELRMLQLLAAWGLPYASNRCYLQNQNPVVGLLGAGCGVPLVPLYFHLSCVSESGAFRR